MKVAFYCDVPRYYYGQILLTASNMPYGQPSEGWKRVRFEVELPMIVADETVGETIVAEVT